jgi:uncharacterized protein (TIGR02466 family)
MQTAFSSTAVAPQASRQLSVHGVFATPLIQGRLDNAAALNAELRRRILAHEQANPGRRVSIAGGWQSEIDFHRWSGPAGEHLLNTLLGAVRSVTRIRAGMNYAPSWRVFAWANVIRKGHFNYPHTHPGNFWSAVYYVDDGGQGGRNLGGEIEFYDPRGAAPAMYNPFITPATPDGEAGGASLKIPPTAGSFLIFPSYLNHAVAPYHGDAVRISIAANFALSEPDSSLAWTGPQPGGFPAG